MKVNNNHTGFTNAHTEIMESNIDPANSAVGDWSGNSNGMDDGDASQEEKEAFTLPSGGRRRCRLQNVRSSAIVGDSTALNISRPIFLDHYSLQSSSSSVNFRSSRMHICNQSGSQIMLEECVTSKMGVAQAMIQAAAGEDGENNRGGDDNSGDTELLPIILPLVKRRTIFMSTSLSKSRGLQLLGSFY